MKTEQHRKNNTEQHPPAVLSSVKKRTKIRGKKKPRSAISREGAAAGDRLPPPSYDETSPEDVVASQYAEDPSETTCETCGIQMKNAAQLAAHLNSKRHARRRRELRILAALSETPQVTEVVTDKEALAARLARGNARLEAAAPLKDDSLPDCITRHCEGKVRRRVSYSCSLCDVQLTSLVKVQEHLVTKRHTALRDGLPDPIDPHRRPARKSKTKANVKNSWFW